MGLAHNGERRIHDGVMTIRSGPGEPAASRLPRRAGEQVLRGEGDRPAVDPHPRGNAAQVTDRAPRFGAEPDMDAVVAGGYHARPLE